MNKSPELCQSKRKLFYRQTEDEQILKFRKELADLSADEIYNRLQDLQEDERFMFALECFDEIHRRRQISLDLLTAT